MRRYHRTLAIAGVVAAFAGPAGAQQPGGIFRVGHFDSPASMSLHEEATRRGERGR